MSVASAYQAFCRPAWLALAASSAMLSSPAQSANIPDNLVPSLKYRVRGTITADCKLSQPTNLVPIIDAADAATDTVRAATADLPFDISCNMPVRVSMTSANGGLKFAGLGTSDTDFTTLLAYRAQLNLPGASATLACESNAMGQAGLPCRADLSNPVTSGSGAIRVQLHAGGQLLIAGQYQDQVTLTVSPQLGGGG